jgi:tetratricopeptide (TPR) repeat protein
MLQTGPAIDPRALDLYVRGRHWWNRRGGAALLQSIDYFHQALDSEPGFALAWSGLGDAYVQLGYASLLRPDDAFPKARAAALRALELDSTLAEPHATLAFVAMYFDWNWTVAEQEFGRALARNPNYATAHEWYGLFLAAMGRFDEALAQERRAQELDPLSVPVAATAGWVLHYSGRHDDAARELKIVLREDPTYALGHLYLGRVYQLQGQLDSALARYGATGPLRNWVPTIAGVGYVYGLQRRRTDALSTIARMDSLAQTEYVTAYAYALVHTALGQPDSAFTWLDRAVNERTHWLVWLNRDFRWAPLRADPRFAQIGRRVGVPP